VSGVGSHRTSCGHAHALELAREGVPLNIIQRQLGHANLGTTSIYLQGIDPEEIIAAVHTRRAPMMSATAGLKLRPEAPRKSGSGGADRYSRSPLAKRVSRPPRGKTLEVVLSTVARGSASTPAPVRER
jgi:hypothetical protein